MLGHYFRNGSLFVLLSVISCFSLEGRNRSQAIKMSAKQQVAKGGFESRFLKAEATQASVDAISIFSTLLSEAIRENTNQAKQISLVRSLEKALSKSYRLNVFFSGEELIATDINTLLRLVQTISSQVSFDSRLVGNFSVKKYKLSRKLSRYLELDTLTYAIQRLNPAGVLSKEPSISAIYKERFVIVEEGSAFKIKEFSSSLVDEVFFAENLKF